MHPLSLLSYFTGGAVLMNAIPHLVSGLIGRRFPSPFAKPTSNGLSSATYPDRSDRLPDQPLAGAAQRHLGSTC